MKWLRRNIFAVMIGIIGIICLMVIYYRIYPLSPKVIIQGHTYYLEIAATDAEKEKGLGYRESLDLDKGMAFPYDRKDYFQFWMKGMNFPLDFLWVADNVIVDITKHVPVMTGNAITIIKPSKPVNVIIEFNAGFADRNGIKIGDAVKFKN